MKTFRNFLLLTFAVIMTAMLTGCGNKNQPQTSERTPAEEQMYQDSLAAVNYANIDAELNAPEQITDFDVFLDKYEKVVDEYDKLITEMKSGNIDSQSAFNAATKAQEMQENIEASKNKMSSSQLQRLNKITVRLSKLATKAATINPDDIKSVNGVDLGEFQN